MAKAVFVCYNGNDEKKVNIILDEMKRNRISYFKAPEMIPEDSTYGKSVPVAIADSKLFVLFFSKNAQDSVWVEKEVECAISNRIPILVLQIGKVTINKTYRFYLEKAETISFTEDPDWALKASQEKMMDMLNMSTLSFVATKTGIVKRREIDWPQEDEPDDIPESWQQVLAEPRTEEQKRLTRANALLSNAIPRSCQKCGHKVEAIAPGTYQCISCGFKHYDQYRTIRNFLEDGPKTVTEIMKGTGFDRKTVENYIREEKLETPYGAEIMLACSMCGTAIRTGFLCDSCKKLKPNTERETRRMENKLDKAFHYRRK